MKNEEFLKRVSKLQKELRELYFPAGSGLVAIREGYVHVAAKKFHELERENLLEHISKELDEKVKSWRLEAMTPDGVKVIALEDIGDVGEKK